MMSTNTPATVAEIKAACTGIDSDTVVSMIERGMNLADCQREWMGELNSRLQRAQRGDTRAVDANRKPGVSADLPAGGERRQPDEGDGDAIEQFSAKVNDIMQRNGGDRQKAIVAVANRYPDLHHAYLLATNAGNPSAQRMLADKFNLV